MRWKTLSLVVGAFALVASLGIAQVASATHETIEQTPALTGGVVPAYTACPRNDASLSRHANPIPYNSCTTTSTDDISDLLIGKPFVPKPCTPNCGFKSSFNIFVISPSPGAPTGWGSSDQTDVKVVSSSSGVLCENASLFTATGQCPSGTGGPYSGNTIGTSTLTTTDHNNCAAGAGVCNQPGTRSATVRDFDFSFVIPCNAGNCNITSTADVQFRLAPADPYDPVRDPTILGKRADIQIQSVKVFDAGPNGNAGGGCPLTCGDGDEELSGQQGLFIP